MSLTSLSHVALHFMDSTSDKLYVLQVIRDDSGPAPVFKGMGYYGRRGSKLSEAKQYEGASEAAAKAACDKKEREQRRKGYIDFAGGAIPGMPASAPPLGAASAPGTPTPTAAAASAMGAKPAATGPVVMLAETTKVEHVLTVLIPGDTHCSQRKYDGERCPVSVRRSGLMAFNRKGVVRPLTAEAEKSLKRLIALPDFNEDRETLIDGELMGDVYVAYDILVLRDVDVKHLPYVERFSMLEELLANYADLLAETAWSPEEKAALRRKAEAEAWEGLIHREMNSPYTGGKSKAILKDKLWEDCTCRVLTVNAQRSVRLAVREEDGSETPVGNCTIPPNHQLPEPDDLVDVRYLYLGAGGALYQPVYKGPRTDKDDADLRSSLRAAPPEKAAPALPAAASAPAAAEPAASVVAEVKPAAAPTAPVVAAAVAVTAAAVSVPVTEEDDI